MSALHIVTARGGGHLTARERRAIAQMVSYRARFTVRRVNTEREVL